MIAHLSWFHLLPASVHVGCFWSFMDLNLKIEKKNQDAIIRVNNPCEWRKGDKYNTYFFTLNMIAEPLKSFQFSFNVIFLFLIIDIGCYTLICDLRPINLHRMQNPINMIERNKTQTHTLNQFTKKRWMIHRCKILSVII